MSTVRDDALGGDDVTGLLARLARREVSAAELREAARARADEADERLNAVTRWVDDGPEPRPGGEAPFSGIPTVIKDNEDLAGHPTSQGSAAVPDTAATSNAPWVAQFLRLGLAPLAKTTLPEFGLTATTESLRHGPTRNPWDTSRSTGGSSGGSAALVAAGVVPMAHANDGGGSIRIPAACCGLVGLKPTRGRLIDRPELERMPVRITTQGVLTRSVRDTALYYARAEEDYRDRSLPPVGHVTGPGDDRLRIGVYVEGLRGVRADAATTAAVRRAAETLESLGHRVEETAPPVDDGFGPDFLRHWALIALVLRYAGGGIIGPGFDGSRVEPFTAGLARFAGRNAIRVPGSIRRLRAISLRHEGDAYDRYDVLLSPVLAHEPPPIGHLGPDIGFRDHMVRLMRYALFTPWQNITGSPAISLPLGRSPAGLPIGVHLAAPFGQDRRLLGLAYELEDASPWPTVPTG